MEKTKSTSSAVVMKAKEEKKTEEGEVIRFVVRPRNNVRFEVGTIDNEGMGKKKSKVCCIFNKAHTLDSSSSSDCDSFGSHDSHNDKNRYDRLPKHQRRAMREQKKKKE